MNSPMTTHDLESLIERVKAATGPDRDIDRLLQLFLLNDGRTGNFKSTASWLKAAKDQRWNTPGFSRSVDESLALVERVLPGWVVADLSQNSRMAGDPWGCELALYFGSEPSKNRSAKSGHDYSKPAIAILTTLLLAKLSLTKGTAENGN